MAPRAPKNLPNHPWPERDVVAFTLDGTVLLNARALERVDLQELVRRRDVFVGVRITPVELRLLRVRLYDGTSEAAAFIAGKRWKRAKRRAERAAKTGA